MPQQDLFTEAPTIGLLVEIVDQTLLTLTDATEIVFRYRDSREDTHWITSVHLMGLEQDFIEEVLNVALVAWRYGTAPQVRAAVREATIRARAHAKAAVLE